MNILRRLINSERALAVLIAVELVTLIGFGSTLFQWSAPSL